MIPAPSSFPSLAVAGRALACALGLVISIGNVGAQSADRSAERLARRLQLQMQNLQQQLQDAEAAKAKGEADKAAVDKLLMEQAQQVSHLRGALPAVNEKLRAADAARAGLAARVAALEQQLAEQKRSAEDALAAKGRESAQSAKARAEQEAQHAQLQLRHDAEVAQVAECSAKNERLVRLSAELLERWRNKSVADVLRQKEPLLGLGDVQMFNLVQAYRDKADAERFTPGPKR